jgi:hypothetical protein
MAWARGQLLEQGGRPLADAMQGTRSIQRHPHDAALLGQCLQNCLANPPHRVRDELDTLGLVEFVGRTNETEVALVDEIGKGDALILVLLGHRDHEAEIAADQLVQRFTVTDTDPLRQADLLFLRDQRILADFA